MPLHRYIYCLFCEQRDRKGFLHIPEKTQQTCFFLQFLLFCYILWLIWSLSVARSATYNCASLGTATRRHFTSGCPKVKKHTFLVFSSSRSREPERNHVLNHTWLEQLEIERKCLQIVKGRKYLLICVMFSCPLYRRKVPFMLLKVCPSRTLHVVETLWSISDDPRRWISMV